jgi:hypothetical protein
VKTSNGNLEMQEHLELKLWLLQEVKSLSLFAALKYLMETLTDAESVVKSDIGRSDWSTLA